MEHLLNLYAIRKDCIILLYLYALGNSCNFNKLIYYKELLLISNVYNNSIEKFNNWSMKSKNIYVTGSEWKQGKVFLGEF
jgi:hypothetical protein